MNCSKKSIRRTSFETLIPATTVWLCYTEMITNEILQTATRMDFFGLFIIFGRILSTVSSDIDFRPDPFTLHKQPFSLNFLRHLQICFWSYTYPNALFSTRWAKVRLAVLIDCVLAYSNTKNIFYALMNGISLHKILNTWKLKGKNSCYFWTSC